MTAADKNMHNQISIMHFHAQLMQKFVFEKSGYAKLSTKVHPRLGLEQPRCVAGQSRTTIACRNQQRPWNNFLVGIFHFVLKIFQSVEYYSKPERGWWNIGIPAASVESGIDYSNIPQKGRDYFKAAMQGN
jgi:hypothetical protein